MKLPSARADGGGTTAEGEGQTRAQGGPHSSGFFFQVKSAITKRLEQVLGPGDFDLMFFRPF